MAELGGGGGYFYVSGGHSFIGQKYQRRKVLVEKVLALEIALMQSAEVSNYAQKKAGKCRSLSPTPMWFTINT